MTYNRFKKIINKEIKEHLDYLNDKYELQFVFPLEKYRKDYLIKFNQENRKFKIFIPVCLVFRLGIKPIKE